MNVDANSYKSGKKLAVLWEGQFIRKTVILLFIIIVCTVLQSCASLVSKSTNRLVGEQTTYNQSNAMHVLMNSADTAYNSSDWESAAVHYEQILSQIPHDAYAWFRLGNILTRLGHINRAIYAYETSLTHDSAQFKSWFNMSTAHLLSAKIAILNSLKSISVNDPSRVMALSRLDSLTLLLE